MTEPEHQCTPPDPGEGLAVASFTCDCGRTLVRDRDTGEWQPVNQDQSER